MKRYYIIPVFRVIELQNASLCQGSTIPDRTGDNSDDPPRNDDDDVFTRKFSLDWE